MVRNLSDVAKSCTLTALRNLYCILRDDNIIIKLSRT